MRWTRFVLPISLILAAGIYLLALDPYIGGGYDDGHYIALARALATQKGFSQILMPGNPPESQYPPGWPLLLTPIWWIWDTFPANAIGFKLVSVLCALAFVAVSYGWMRWRGEGEIVSVLVMLLTLFNPLILGLATSAYAEMAYACFSFLALWLIERYNRLPEATWRDAIIPSLVAAFAMYVRSFGVMLMLAATVYLWLQPDRRKGLIFASLSFLWIAPWFVRAAWLPSGAWTYSQQFILKSMEQPELGVIGWGDLVVRLVFNLRAYLLAGLPGAVMPSQVPLTYVNLAQGLRVGSPFAGSDVFLAVLVAGGLLGQILLRRALSDWYVAFYLGLALLWPWEPTRFVVPLIPLLYRYVFFEINLLATALKQQTRWTRMLRFAALAAVAIFILANVVTQVKFAWTIHQTVEPSPEWGARFRLFDWIKRNTTQTSVLAAMNDYQVFLYTDRAVVRDLGSTEALRHYGVDYVVLIPYGGVMVSGDLSRMRFDPIYRANPSAFTWVYADEPASIEVFRVQREALAR